MNNALREQDLEKVSELKYFYDDSDLMGALREREGVSAEEFDKFVTARILTNPPIPSWEKVQMGLSASIRLVLTNKVTTTAVERRSAVDCDFGVMLAKLSPCTVAHNGDSLVLSNAPTFDVFIKRAGCFRTPIEMRESGSLIRGDYVAPTFATPANEPTLTWLPGHDEPKIFFYRVEECGELGKTDLYAGMVTSIYSVYLSEVAVRGTSGKLFVFDHHAFDDGKADSASQTMYLVEVVEKRPNIAKVVLRYVVQQFTVSIAVRSTEAVEVTVVGTIFGRYLSDRGSPVENESFRTLLQVRIDGAPAYFDLTDYKRTFRGRLMWGMAGKEVYRGLTLLSSDDRFAFDALDQSMSVVVKTFRRAESTAAHQREAKLLTYISNKVYPADATMSFLKGVWADGDHFQMSLRYISKNSMLSWLHNVSKSLCGTRERLARLAVYDWAMFFSVLPDIVHLDNTVENIVVDGDANSCVPIDFGEARSEEDCLNGVHLLQLGLKPFYHDERLAGFHEEIRTNGIDLTDPKLKDDSAKLRKLQTICARYERLRFEELKKLDSWCLGVVMLQIMTGEDLSHYAKTHIPKIQIRATLLAKNRPINIPFDKLQLIWLDHLDGILEAIGHPTQIGVFGDDPNPTFLGEFSGPCMNLLRKLLSADYGSRPTIEEILAHEWFTHGLDEDTRKECFGEVDVAIPMSLVKRHSGTTVGNLSPKHSRTTSAAKSTP